MVYFLCQIDSCPYYKGGGSGKSGLPRGVGKRGFLRARSSSIRNRNFKGKNDDKGRFSHSAGGYPFERKEIIRALSNFRILNLRVAV